MASQKTYPTKRGDHYYIQDRKLPGVTSVLKMVVDKSGPLMGWALKLAHEYMVDNPGGSSEAMRGHVFGSRDKATNKGSTVHSFLEARTKVGGTLDTSGLPTEIRPYCEAALQFEREHPHQIKYNECIVANFTYGYAGTVDRIATRMYAEGDDIGYENWLYDWKTGKGVYDEAHLQVTAYKHAEYIWIPTEKKLIPMPKIDRVAIVHLRPTGKASLIPVDADAESFEDFIAAKRWYDRMKRRG